MPPLDLDAIRAALAPSRRLGPSSDLDLNPGLGPHRQSLRPAAVLVGLIEGQHGPEVLLTRRAAHLRHHPGQVALPGGRVEPDDASVEACALREAAEEVGLPIDAAEVLGRLDPHETVTGFEAQPVIARLGVFEPRPDPEEVAEIFTLPLTCLADLDAYRLEVRRWQGQARHYWVLPFGPWYVWGATARILRGLALRLRAEQNWR